MEFTLVTLADFTALIEHVNAEAKLQTQLPAVQVSEVQVSEVLEEKNQTQAEQTQAEHPLSGDDLYFQDRSRLC